MKKLYIILFVILVLLVSACFINDEKEETVGTSDTIQITVTTTSVSLTPTEIITLTTTTPPEIPPTEAYENPIVQTAEALIGIEFTPDGASPSEGFDNSGFIYYVLRENGYIGCPRQISGQLEWGENAGYDEIKAGDVVYFSEQPDGEASFGGIYCGGGVMIYSPYPGETVKKTDITAEYWKSRFVTALSL